MISNRNQYILMLLFIWLIALLVNGCSERESILIDPDLNSSDPTLVAHGMIEEGDNAYINLSYTRDMDSSEPVYVENALVTLSVSDGNSEVLDYKGNGLYEGSAIIGEIGKSYTLEIQIDNRTWSATSTIYPHLVILEARAEIVGGAGGKSSGDKNTGVTQYTPVWHVADDPDTRDYFLFRFFINDEYVPELTWDYDDGRGINTNGYHALIHPRLYLSLTDTLTIKASRIDLQTYKFYNQFERLIVYGGKTGGITPYNPSSNFGEGVVGYFMAISSASVEIVPDTSISEYVPTNVTAIAGNGQITISWNPVDSADSYSIFYIAAKDGKKEQESEIAGIASPPYIHRELERGVTYYYRVAANIGTEAYSSGWVSATLN